MLIDKGIGMMMKNMAEELAPLDSLLIPFQIYKIKGGQSQDLMTIQMRPTWVNMQIHVIDKEVENSGYQTIEETMNTNKR